MCEPANVSCLGQRSRVSSRVALRIAKVLFLAGCALVALWLGLERASLPAEGKKDGGGEMASGLRLTALYAGLSGSGGQDEAFQIANVSEVPLFLDDAVQVGEDGGHVVSFLASGITLAAGSRTGRDGAAPIELEAAGYG